MSPLSRDISHIRDNLRVQIPIINDYRNQKINELPLDINLVKKIIDSSDCFGNPLNKGVPVKLNCRKEACIHSVYDKEFEESSEIEKMFLGSPTGRQESENLKK